MFRVVAGSILAIVFLGVDFASAQPQFLSPGPVLIDPTGNGILEPGETIAIQPSWRNNLGGTQCAAGTLSNFIGPPGPTYSIVDGMGNYGCFPAFTTVFCFDCYQVRIDAATRPTLHWHATFLESLNSGTFSNSTDVHVGATFVDVDPISPFYRYVERIVHRGVTGGCAAGAYCPAAPVTRAQMAVFVLVAKEGAAYTPPACTTPMFADVPASSPFCRWIEELARRGVVTGCGGGNYCPEGAATRDAMAVFVLRTLDPALNPAPCTAPVFADVPASSPFCPWIEELARRNVVSGCGGGNYCPAAAVTREQMSVFLAVAFNLTL